VCLVAAPLSTLLVRSAGLSILPATNYSLRALLSALEQSRFDFRQTIESLVVIPERA
jgi:hypothetical protein